MEGTSCPYESVTEPQLGNATDAQDIIRMIIQYLGDEGYVASKMTVHDEANLKLHEKEERTSEAKRLKKAILGWCFDVIATTVRCCAGPLTMQAAIQMGIGLRWTN